MPRVYRVRVITSLILLLFALAVPLSKLELPNDSITKSPLSSNTKTTLDTLDVKGRAAKTGYSREQFGDGWQAVNGCSTREIILARDLRDISIDRETCKVLTGTLSDPYTGKIISFTRGPVSSQDVQIDHIVALSNAWQTGAQQLEMKQRLAFANDPLNLLAVDGDANQQKSDGDAATWLPSNKSFRCVYIARQIEVKAKYKLWVTPSEKAAMTQILGSC